MKKIELPLISIITPVYNAGKYLPETIKSIQLQTHSHFEYLLVVDRKSVDDSLQIAESAAKNDSRFKVFIGPDPSGAASNRNYGLNKATGEWICFLDADDYWAPTKLETQLKFNLQNATFFSFTSFYRVSEDGKNRSQATSVPNKLFYVDILKFNPIACHAAMVHRDWIGDIRFRQLPHEDFVFWLDLLRPQLATSEKNRYACGLNQPLAFYRSVPGSRAHNKFKAALWRWKIIRETEKIPIFFAVKYFIEYAFRALWLHRKTKVKNSP